MKGMGRREMLVTCSGDSFVNFKTAAHYSPARARLIAASHVGHEDIRDGAVGRREELGGQGRHGGGGRTSGVGWEARAIGHAHSAVPTIDFAEQLATLPHQESRAISIEVRLLSEPLRRARQLAQARSLFYIQPLKRRVVNRSLKCLANGAVADFQARLYAS
jgi:hypothetical protein